MRAVSWTKWLVAFGALAVFPPSAAAQSTSSVVDLVRRRMPSHADDFSFEIVSSNTSLSSPSEKAAGKSNDCYTISTLANGTVHVQGNSVSALTSG